MEWKAAVNGALRRFGYQISRHSEASYAPRNIPVDYSDEERALWKQVQDFTMVSPAAVASLRRAVLYIVDAGVPGALLECGVWRGGCSMATALTLLGGGGDTSREIYLFDTYEDGWPAPEAIDVDRYGHSGDVYYRRAMAEGQKPEDTVGHFDSVQKLLLETGYPPERLHFIKGDVMKTIPSQAPETIALMRLDTDWYASTKHEWEHLYARLSVGGVVIVDDYGAWEGSRQATDDFLRENGINLLLNRVDSEGSYIGVKLQ